MKHLVSAVLMLVCGGPVASTYAWQQPAGTAAQPLGACSLMSKEDVRKHLPWPAALDAMAPEEEPIGTTGSSCNYPSVHIQVMPFRQQTIDLLRKKGGLEAVTGVGDEAYFHNNANRYAELYVRVGNRLLTLQASGDSSVDAVKPGVVSLATALVPTLR